MRTKTFKARWAAITMVAVFILPVPAVGQRAVISSASPYSATYYSVASPYWGYSYNPYGGDGFLHGVADVIRSQGQYLINQQEAIRLKEHNRQAKIETRRKEIEHWTWEREYRIDTWERERKKIRDIEVERSRTDPPQSEILAASSLNLLLAELKKESGLSPSLSVPVEAEWLQHVHVTFVTSGAGGNVGLLKGDHVAWPLLLRREEFAPERERIEKLIAKAKREAIGGAVAADTLVETRQQVRRLEQRVFQENRAGRNDLWSPSDYISANRSLREFSAALQMLEREDAAFYLAPLQGKSVAELVQFMKSKGVSFAPATTGCERFYVALHRAMAAELTQARGGK